MVDRERARERRDKLLASQIRTAQGKRGEGVKADLEKRKLYLKKKYGITPERYDRLQWEQKGVCAICKFRYKGRRTYLHKIGDTFAFLCYKCNRVVVAAEGDTESLSAISKYIIAHEAQLLESILL